MENYAVRNQRANFKGVSLVFTVAIHRLYNLSLFYCAESALDFLSYPRYPTKIVLRPYNLSYLYQLVVSSDKYFIFLNFFRIFLLITANYHCL